MGRGLGKTPEEIAIFVRYVMGPGRGTSKNFIIWAKIK